MADLQFAPYPPNPPTLPEAATLVHSRHTFGDANPDQLREELFAAKEQLGFVLESIQDYALMLLDVDGNVTGWSAGAEKILAYKEHEILGQKIHRIFTTEDVEQGIPEREMKLSQTEGRATDDRWHVRKDGTRFWATGYMRPLFLLENGKQLRGFAKLVRELTATKHAEERIKDLNQTLGTRNQELKGLNEDLLNLIRNVNVPVILLGKNHHLRLATPAARQLFAINQSTGSALPDLNLNIPHADLKLLITSVMEQLTTVQKEIQDSQGRWFNLQIQPYKTTEDAVDGAVLLFSDIQNTKEREVAAAQWAAELKTRVIESTSELIAANNELEAFSYSVAHDLRAPLRGLSGFSQILLEDYATQLDAKGKDYLQRICLASQRMGQLIDDLLSFSSLARDQIRQDTVDLSRLAEVQLEELKKEDPQRDVQWSVSPGLTAMGDEGLIRIALVNLLRNAWKFTSEHPHARIVVGREEKDGEQIFYVRDDGAGFDTAYIDQLFGVFKRLHTQEDFRGSGIGLAIVQRIIHRHGGRVWATGAIEQGATFYFTLGPRNLLSPS